MKIMGIISLMNKFSDNLKELIKNLKSLGIYKIVISTGERLWSVIAMREKDKIV